MSKPAARAGDSTVHGGTLAPGVPTVLIGSKPAARVGDMHICPMVTPGTPPIPHVGGPLLPSPPPPAVLIANVPAATIGSMCTCTGPPDTVLTGEVTVLLGMGGAGAGSPASPLVVAKITALQNELASVLGEAGKTLKDSNQQEMVSDALAAYEAVKGVDAVAAGEPLAHAAAASRNPEAIALARQIEAAKDPNAADEEPEPQEPESGEVAVAVSPWAAEPKPAPVSPYSIPQEKTCSEVKVTSLRWEKNLVFCSDSAVLSGTTEHADDGQRLNFDVLDKSSNKAVAAYELTVKANAFRVTWPMTDILPNKAGSSYLDKMTLIASCQGTKSANELVAHFIPSAAKQVHVDGRKGFGLSTQDYVAVIDGTRNYIKGWSGKIIKLGSAVRVGTGGLIGELAWMGYRWMKTEGVEHKYWNGREWVALPDGFNLSDSRQRNLPFIKKGEKFKCVYGGEWPESFEDWNDESNANQNRIKAWEATIKKVWSDRFRLKNVACNSANAVCCSYVVKCEAKFVKKENWAKGDVVIVPGNGRSSSNTWFIISNRETTTAHEFGHLIGNPDEYEGASTVDPSVNGDGAVNGIDTDSIMGQNMNRAKKRHFDTVAKHMKTVVHANTGRNFVFDVVDK